MSSLQSHPFIPAHRNSYPGSRVSHFLRALAHHICMNLQTTYSLCDHVLKLCIKRIKTACFLSSSRNNLLRAVLCCCVGFSLAVESGGCSPVGVLGLLIAVASLAAGHGLQGTPGFSSCSTRAQQSSFWALEHRLKHRFSCSAALRSSQIRNQTCSSCNGRWVLYH